MSASSNSKNLQEVTIPARHNTVLYGVSMEFHTNYSCSHSIIQVASFGSTIDVHIVNALLGAPSWQLRGPMPDGLHPGKAQNTLLVCQERIGNPDDWPPTTHTVVIEPALKDRKLSLSFGHENVGTAPPGPAKYVQVGGVLQ